MIPLDSQRLFLAFFGLSLFWSVPGSAFGASLEQDWPGSWQKMRHPIYASKSIRLSLEASPSAKLSEVLRVEQPGRKARNVELPNAVGYVSDIRYLRLDTYMLLQSSTAPYSAFLFYHNDSNSVSEPVTGYNPTLSPNGNYIIFKRFFPPHFADYQSAYSNFAMLFDTRKSVRDNTGIQPAVRDPISSTPEVGYLLYPNSFVLEPDPSVPGDDYPYSFPSTFVWSADSTKVIFLEEHETSLVSARPGAHNFVAKKPYFVHPLVNLVLVDLKSGRPHVYTTPANECSVSQGPTCGLRLSAATFSPSSVTVTLNTIVAVQRAPIVKTVPLTMFTLYQ